MNILDQCKTVSLTDSLSATFQKFCRLLICLGNDLSSVTQFEVVSIFCFALAFRPTVRQRRDGTGLKWRNWNKKTYMWAVKTDVVFRGSASAGSGFFRRRKRGGFSRGIFINQWDFRRSSQRTSGGQADRKGGWIKLFLYINQCNGLSDTLLLRLLPEETSPKKAHGCCFIPAEKDFLKQTPSFISHIFSEGSVRPMGSWGGKKIETFYFLFGFN